MLAFELGDALLQFTLTRAKFGLSAFGGLDLGSDGKEQR
jgi:hypothetical protein